jgi:hypothetical protein
LFGAGEYRILGATNHEGWTRSGSTDAASANKPESAAFQTWAGTLRLSAMSRSKNGAGRVRNVVLS